MADQADPSPGQPTSGIGLPSEKSFTGPWLSQQLLLTLFFGLSTIASFSILVKRRSWRGYLTPIDRKSDHEDDQAHVASAPRLNNGSQYRIGRALSAVGLDWLAVALCTSDEDTAHLSGPPASSIDTLTLLKFFRFGTRLFAWLTLWSIFVLMPVNWRENGWLDGVRPGEDGDKKHKKPQTAGDLVLMAVHALKDKHGDESEKPLPVPPGPPTLPSFQATTLYDGTHLATLFFITGILMWLLTTHTSEFLALRQRILHSLHSSLASRSILIRSLPTTLRSPEAVRAYFGDQLQMPVNSAWVLPDVGMGVRKLLKERENALRDLERAWASFVGNPVRRDMQADWEPALIEERITERAQRILNGEELLPTRGWIASGRPHRDPESRDEEASAQGESTPLLSGNEDVVPPLHSDPSYGPPSFVSQRPTRRLHLLSRTKVDLLADLEVRFLRLDVAVGHIRKSMLQGDWKPIGVAFVEFQQVKDALVSAQTLYFERENLCRTVMAPDSRDVIWRNVGIPTGERRMRQLLISIAITLLYLFYLPPLLFLGSLLSPAFLNKYIPGLYKLLSASPRLEALVSTSLPSLVLVIFNAMIPMLLEQTAIWQGIRTRSGVEMSVLKKYHIFLVTSVIFIFIVTGTAFGVLLDLSANPMRILDKLSLSLPLARNFSLSYVILQSFAVLPLQLLSVATLFFTPVYVITAKTPREHAEAHPATVFKAGTVYPQALIVATLGLVYAIVKPLVTLFAMFYFAIGYVVFKYKLLFVFYPPPNSTQASLTRVLRPRLIFAVFLFQVFQLSLFSVHGQVFLVLLTLPLMAATVWYGRFLHKSFKRLETYEALEGAIEADSLNAYEDEDAAATAQAVTAGEEQRGRKTTVAADVPHWPSESSEASPAISETEWRRTQQLRDDGGGTGASGASTPSELTPSIRSASAGPRGGRRPDLGRTASKKIWSPFARLKRRGRGGGGGGDGDEDADGAAATGGGRRRGVFGPSVLYHRPESRYTDYREPYADSGIESLPGIVERPSRLSSSLSRTNARARATSLTAANGDGLPRGETTAPGGGGSAGDVEVGVAPVAFGEHERAELGLEEVDSDVEEEEGVVETYEHPAIRGMLKQVWLPSR